MIIKVCGMQDPENMKVVAATGPDMMGLIFYPASPRYFRGELPGLPKSLNLAGVFVNETIEQVVHKTVHYQLDYLQLHGNESPDYCTALQEALNAADSNADLIKVFSVSGEEDLSECASYAGRTRYFLFDTKGKYHGGNGLQFNWSVLQAYSLEIPFLLSGGIGPEDVEDLMEFLNTPAGKYCAGVDVNSGFEIQPGLKDTKQIKKFISRMRESENIEK